MDKDSLLVDFSSLGGRDDAKGVWDTDGIKFAKEKRKSPPAVSKAMQMV